MLKIVYLGLKERLESIPNVEEIDFYLGQYLQTDGSVLYTDEALFIEFLPITWESLAKKVQRAVLSFRIHAVSACLYDDETRLMGTTVSDHMDLVTQVFQVLQNFRIVVASGDVILESIVRVEQESNHELDVFIATVQEFQATIFDYSAKGQKVNKSIDLVFNKTMK